MFKKYDVAVIGAGPGGYTAAIRLSRLGKNVCMIEISEERLGGVCLNEGCIPAKAIMQSSKIFSSIRKAASYGIEAEAKAPDMKKIVASSRDVTAQLKSGLKGLFKKHEIDLIFGSARMISKNGISVIAESGSEEKIEADKIIIATGSSPKMPSNIKADGKTVLTSREAIGLEDVPGDLLVIGAGAIGVEFSSIFAAFGSKVTLAEAMPDILPFEDAEISKALRGSLKKRGIEVLVGASIKDLRRKNNSVEAVLSINGIEKKMGFSRALIAVGRKANIGDIGLERAGVKVKDGFIATDGRMMTNIGNIYAVGDVVNTPMYAHAAYEEGAAAAEDIAGIKRKPIDYDCVPNVVFSEPQVASVGMTETKAREKKKDAATSKYFFKANGMAVAARRDEGFLKIVADKKTRVILGAHIIGGEASEMIHEFVVAKRAGLKTDDIADAVHAHPTFSEIAAAAARNI